MRRIALALTTAAALTWNVGAAVASCAPSPPMRTAIDDAPVVFVGTVREVTNSDRWATVEVTEVWKGDVEAQVEVKAGPEDPAGPMGVASSVDRTYDAGKTYLFLPHAGSRNEFKDSICSRTTVYREDLARFRPAGALHLDGRATGGGADDSAVPWWAIGLAVAAVVTGALAVQRRIAS